MDIDLGARLLQKLEEWRELQELSKTDMAALFKLRNKQTYSNWVGRGTLPKDQLERAMTVITCSDLNEARYFMRGHRPRRALQHLVDAINEDPETTRIVRSTSELLKIDEAEELANALSPSDQREALEIFAKRLPPAERFQFAVHLLSDLEPDFSSK